MKRAILGFVCLLLAGCDYTVPLVEKPTLEIDPSIVGVWEVPKQGGETQSLLILPLDKHEYMVSFPAGSPDAIFARGSLWQSGEIQLFQLDWFGTAQGKLPDDNRTFQFGMYTVKEDQLSVRLLNTDVVSPKVTSTEALIEAVKMNNTRPNLFKEPMVFTKSQK